MKIYGYDKVLQLSELDFCKLIEIRVDLYGDIKKILLVASYHTPIDAFVALHEDGLFFMLNAQFTGVSGDQSRPSSVMTLPLSTAVSLSEAAAVVVV